MNKRSNHLENLETSKMWKQAVKVADEARHFADVLPHHERYTLADPIYRNATLVTSDIAFALGKGGAGLAADYRYARGHLFTVKSLVLMAQHYELVKQVKHVLNDITTLQNMLDDKIRELEAADDTTEKGNK